MNDLISKTLASLHKGQQVTVIYDGRFEQERLHITGKVVTVDHFWKMLQINKISIDFSEIHDIQV